MTQNTQLSVSCPCPLRPAGHAVAAAMQDYSVGSSALPEVETHSPQVFPGLIATLHLLLVFACRFSFIICHWRDSPRVSRLDSLVLQNCHRVEQERVPHAVERPGLPLASPGAAVSKAGTAHSYQLIQGACVSVRVPVVVLQKPSRSSLLSKTLLICWLMIEPLSSAGLPPPAPRNDGR